MGIDVYQYADWGGGTGNAPTEYSRSVSQSTIEAMLTSGLSFKVRNTRNHSQPLKLCGTRFMVASGYFITCWHCVREPLAPEESYAAPVLPRTLLPAVRD